jgi:uncharacterized membrane protein YccC
MTLEFLQMHWAPAAASIVGLAVVLFVGWRAWLDSSRGRLRAARRRLLRKRREAAQCLRAGERAKAKLEGLAGRSESVKPVRLQAARDALEDAEALLKIARDQVLIAENHVRKIIVEEFPPKRHERLRRRCLPGEGEDGKPFSF